MNSVVDFLLKWAAKCSTWNIIKTTFIMVILSGFFQAIIAIVQFLYQKSLGLAFLKESIFSPLDVDVAKVIIENHIFVRSYGLFPHPNILGGFLAVSLLITIVYPVIFKLKLFHVEQSQSNHPNVPRGTIFGVVLNYLFRFIDKCSTWNNYNPINPMFHVEHYRYIWLYRGLIFFQLLALFVSFSKSAIIAFILGLILVILKIRQMFHVEQSQINQPNVPRGTI